MLHLKWLMEQLSRECKKLLKAYMIQPQGLMMRCQGRPQKFFKMLKKRKKASQELVKKWQLMKWTSKIYSLNIKELELSTKVLKTKQQNFKTFSVKSKIDISKENRSTNLWLKACNIRSKSIQLDHLILSKKKLKTNIY